MIDILKSRLQDYLTILFVLVADFIWITANTKMYMPMYENVQRSPVKMNYVAAAIAYVFILASVFFVAVPLTSALTDPVDIFVRGGMVGWTMYGVYNFTNLAVFSYYQLKTALIDTAWGGVLFGLATLLYSQLRNRGN